MKVWICSSSYFIWNFFCHERSVVDFMRSSVNVFRYIPACLRSSSDRQQEPAVRSACCPLPYQILHPAPQRLHQWLQWNSVYARLDVVHCQQTGTAPRPLCLSVVEVQVLRFSLADNWGFRIFSISSSPASSTTATIFRLFWGRPLLSAFVSLIPQQNLVWGGWILGGRAASLLIRMLVVQSLATPVFMPNILGQHTNPRKLSDASVRLWTLDEKHCLCEWMQVV